MSCYKPLIRLYNPDNKEISGRVYSLARFSQICGKQLKYEALNEPCYSHLVKATTDGKDWYDCYNNETIFFMDDVGQQVHLNGEL